MASAATSTSSTARPGSTRTASAHEVPIPDELADEVALRRDQLLEAAAEADDEVLMKFLEGEEISDEELELCLHKGVKDSILAPVMLTSAHRDIGISAMLDAIVRYLPTPDGGAARRGHGQPRRGRRGRPGCGWPAPGAGLQDDRRPLRRSPHLLPRLVRAPSRPTTTSGTPTRGEEERIGQVFYIKGKEQEAVDEIRAGEIGAVAKLVHTVTGDTLSTQGPAPHHGSPSQFPSRPCRWPSSQPPRPTWTSSARP